MENNREKHLTIFCESYEQTIRQNTLQEVVHCFALLLVIEVRYLYLLFRVLIPVSQDTNIITIDQETQQL